VLCVFVQGGTFIPGLVCLGIGSGLGILLAYYLLHILAKPLYAVVMKPFTNIDRAMKATLIITWAGQLILVSFAIAFLAIDEDPRRLNATFVSFFLLLSVNIWMICAVGFTLVKDLEKCIGSLNRESSEAFENFRTQLSSLRKSLIGASAQAGIIAIWPITTLVLGSFPYQWIIFVTNGTAYWSSVFMISRFVGIDRKVADSRSAVISSKDS